MDTRCPECGSLMYYDHNYKRWYCPTCGKNITTSGHVPTPLSIERDFIMDETEGGGRGFAHDQNWYSEQFPRYPGYIPLADLYGVGPPHGSQEAGFTRLYRRSTIYGLVLFYFLLTLNVIALVGALFVVFPSIVNEDVYPLIFLIPFPPFIVGIDASITGYPAAVYFLLIAMGIFLSVQALIMKDGKTFIGLAKRLVAGYELGEQEWKIYQNNSFVLVGELFMAVIFFNVGYIILLLLLGIETRQPDFEDMETWELMYALARASVWEEVVARVLLIGLPLFVIFSIFKRKDSSPADSIAQTHNLRWYHYFIGGRFKSSPMISLLILISSVVFSLAHVQSWDLYKAPPTLIAGFALGYLFVKKGVHTSIILHFAIDYLGMLLEFFPEEIAMMFAVVIGLPMIVLFSMGIIMFYKYTYWFTNHLKNLFGKQDMNDSVSKRF